MSEDLSLSRPLGERLRDSQMVRQSLARSVSRALLQHKRAGNPVAIWRDGQVTWIDPADIPDTGGEAADHG